MLYQLSYPGVALSRDFRYICAVNYKLANMLFDIKELIYGPAYDRCAYTRALLIERLTTLSVIIAIFGAIAGGALYFIGV